MFSLDEANLLLPALEPLLRTAVESNRKLEEAQRALQQASHHVFLSGGSLLNVTEMLALRTRRDTAAQNLRDSLAQIDSRGVQIKDLEIGLLDFPCLVGDDTILLCWKLGEPAIAYWHSVEEGYKGRKPIDARIARAGQKPI